MTEQSDKAKVWPMTEDAKAVERELEAEYFKWLHENPFKDELAWWCQRAIVAELARREAEAKLEQAVAALVEKQKLIHAGQFHQGNPFDICRDKECVRVRSMRKTTCPRARGAK